MDLLPTILGHSIGINDVLDFVTTWLLPTAAGVWVMLAAHFSNLPKRIKLPEPLRTWVVRLLVAACCVAVTVVAHLLSGQPLDVGLLGQSFMAYLTAVTAYEHSSKS